MRNDSANDTSTVTRQESDTKLCVLGVGLSGLGENVFVEEGDGLLKEVELGNSVRDLTTPQRNDRSEGEPCLGGIGRHLSKGGAKGGRPGTWRGGLNLDLHHLHRAECDVSKELCRRRTKTEDYALVLFGILLTSHVRVHVLEVLVETKLEKSLHGITDESGKPSLPNAIGTFLGDNDSEA